MKSALLITILALCLACSEGNTQTAATTTTTPVADAAASVETSPTLDHPCDAISGADLVRVLNWGGANDAMPTTMSDGRIQSCYYSSTDNVGAATITVTQSSEKTIERKGLERSFASDLSNEEGRLSYKTVDANLGDQAIYGFGKRGPSYSYRLQWRVGNTTRYSIDATAYKEQDPEVMLEKLKELTALL